MRIAIDTGGTFTDCVYLENGAPVVLKVLSTPADPAKSVLAAIRQIAAESRVEVRHGTTIGTNALLERKGARVAFVTTAGFEDTIAIGRQARQHLYDWMATPAPCMVPPELRFGIKERVTAEGETLLSPSEQELAELRDKIRASGAQSIAISLLFSFANPENEQRIVTALNREWGGTGLQQERGGTGVQQERGATGGLARPAGQNSVTNEQNVNLPISASHQILPEFREYERAATVVVNAYLAPKAGEYVRRLESEISSQHNSSLYVMQSSGGIISAKLAAQEPVRTVLSGPAGGVVGAQKVAQLAGLENIISFDMGGTSTDVSLIDASGPRITNEARVSELPISVPMLDIHTVGAGGGSLAWFDRGQVLHVGPASAGADPGPICYGRGEQPTVTDANLVLGRLDPEMTLAASVHLDSSRTRHFMEKACGPIASLEQFASGIVQLAEAEMEKTIRLISVERGHNPRDFTLVAFGGAGPLHACSLARALGVPRVLVPAMPGALSALGILMSDVVRDYSRTVMITTNMQDTKEVSFANSEVSSASSANPLRSLRLKALDVLEPHFAELESKAATEFRTEGLVGIPTRSADLRYAGQGYELNVPAGPNMLESFHSEHRKRYSYADESRTVEVVNVRVRMIAAARPIALPRRPKRDRNCSGAVLKRKPVMFDGEWIETPIINRDLLSSGNSFEGPAVVHEYSATTVLPPGCQAEVDEYSNLVIEA